jgi:hypothetical protein
MSNPTESLVEVIRDAITTYFSSDPLLLPQWGASFDACLKESLRRAGQQALEVVLHAEDERQRAALAVSGWRVERRPLATVMTVLGPVTTRSSYLRLAGQREGLRPMLSQYGIHGGQCTEALRRVVTDFGAERSFEKAAEAVHEHYQFEVPSTTLRNVTLREAMRIADAHTEYLETAEAPDPGAEAQAIVAGMDGCALRIIEGRHREYDVVNGERVVRERVRLAWIDVRSAFVRREGAVDRLCFTAAAPFDAVLTTIQGGARHCGMTAATHVVFVGDGGNGLMEASQRAFPGSQFILDRIHLREHIGAVAEFLKVPTEGRKAWVDQIDAMIGHGDVDVVREQLRAHVPRRAKGRPPPKDLVSPFLGYLERFRDCVHYDEYEAKGWPIGSGEIESVHRQGPQPRLKLPGASWRKPNLNAMGGLRAARLSGRWENCWEDRMVA